MQAPSVLERVVVGIITRKITFGAVKAPHSPKQSPQLNVPNLFQSGWLMG